jgi:hypothetical protein
MTACTSTFVNVLDAISARLAVTKNETPAMARPRGWEWGGLLGGLTPIPHGHPDEPEELVLPSTRMP